MKKTETIAIIRPWLGGNNQYSLYVTIPSKIVKRLNITEDTMLKIRLLEDQTITISKHLQDNKKLQKTEESKTKEQVQKHYFKKDETPNPLDGHEF
ncbi:MAG: hypothetical protein OEL84_01755 [Nitrosopumilus sp.]|nr:hypothetical protein [Nitrosopumilus sp.]